MGVLALDFFARPPEVVAPDLLGAVLVSRVGGQRVAARITEVEAYCDSDPASHTFRGRTPRNATMFGEPGHLYVYFSYGMHHCANAVSHLPGRSGGVLMRAAEIVTGADIARERRSNSARDKDLARGPACLAQALGLDRALDGTDLCRPRSMVRLEPRTGTPSVTSGPRVGVSRAADVPWRFWIEGDPTVSAYKRSPRAPASRAGAG